MAISKRTRFEVLRRDDHTCRYCHATGAPLTIDHVIPTTLGGSDEPSNLVAACKDCNAGKSSSSPDATLVAKVSDDAIRWAAAMREAADRVSAGDAVLRERLTAIHDYWYKYLPSYNHDHPKWRLPSDWPHQIECLLNAGLPDTMVWDCIDIAMRARGNIDNAFRYMLGIANNKLRKLQEDAATILAAEDAPADDVPLGSAQNDLAMKWWEQGFDDAFALSLVPGSWFQARALSRVVDGTYWWNTTGVRA